MNAWTVLKDFLKKRFIRSLNHGITNDKGKKLDGHITDEGIFNMYQNLE